LYLETILFPFKGRIIYCGLISTYNIQIGSNMMRSIQAEYQQAKRRFGIITSLDKPLQEKEDSDE
jgi:NADPH-dependent curcumin reductase CurA